VATAIEVGYRAREFGLDLEMACALVPAVSRQTEARGFTDVAKASEDAYFEPFCAIGCASLAIDAGMVKQHVFLDVTLCNALHALKPVLLHVVRGFGGTGRAYARALHDAADWIARDRELRGRVRQPGGADRRCWDAPREECDAAVRPHRCADRSFSLAQRLACRDSPLLKSDFAELTKAARVLNSKPVRVRLGLGVPEQNEVRWTLVTEGSLSFLSQSLGADPRLP
jgi:hypothetical protein